jgi:hypothetical protein
MRCRVRRNCFLEKFILNAIEAVIATAAIAETMDVAAKPLVNRISVLVPDSPRLSA